MNLLRGESIKSESMRGNSCPVVNFKATGPLLFTYYSHKRSSYQETEDVHTSVNSKFLSIMRRPTLKSLVKSMLTSFLSVIRSHLSFIKLERIVNNLGISNG